ncbi:MAG: hypothetical protein AAFU78_15470, partial [Cyanobacteria bacterium J06633_2]
IPFITKRQAAKSVSGQSEAIIGGMNTKELFQIASHYDVVRSMGTTWKMHADYFKLKYTKETINLGEQDIKYVLKLSNLVSGREKFPGYELENLEHLLKNERGLFGGNQETLEKIIDGFTQTNSAKKKATASQERARLRELAGLPPK